jgi:hypothetical protein
MPPICTKKVTLKEKRIATAISEIRDRTLKNITVTAQKHHVPYHKLYHRFHSRPAADSLSRRNKALSIKQEQALLLYIDRCKQLGQPCKHKHIELAANSLL